MKFTMRDKVCQLIGKYQYLEVIIRPAEPAQADMCGQSLTDLNKLLEEDEAAAAQVDPRKTAPAGKWCSESAAQAAERVAKEARNNG